MNSRERVLTALNHKEPDRVPFDLGGTNVTGIQAKAYRGLRQYLGLPEKELVIIDMDQQLARVDDDVMAQLGCDAHGASPGPSSTYKLEVKETADKQYRFYHDEYGIGWRMPVEGGLYYDLFDHPLSGDVTDEMLEQYRMPDPRDPQRYAGLREAALKILEKEQRALVIGNMSAGIFEMYMWTRGFTDSYTDWAGDPQLAGKILHKFMDLQLGYWETIFEVMKGIPIDVVKVGDDLGGQNGMLISPASYRKQLKPLHKEMFDFIHSKSEAKIFIHSCGSIRPVIADLIEVGVDILNPVQVSAVGMDSAELKRQYGRDVCFWGGGVDTQNAFDDRHTPAQVRADVRKRLEDFMPGGGFIFSTVHNIQGNVPPENILAMWEMVRQFGQYG